MEDTIKATAKETNKERKTRERNKSQNELDQKLEETLQDETHGREERESLLLERENKIQEKASNSTQFLLFEILCYMDELILIKQY